MLIHRKQRHYLAEVQQSPARLFVVPKIGLWSLGRRHVGGRQLHPTRAYQQEKIVKNRQQ